MGWLFMLVLVLVVGAGLWRFGRLDRAGLQLVAAGLCLAAAGYAWQGRPGLRGSPARPTEATAIGGEAFAVLRQDILGRFDNAASWLTIADSYLRRGNSVDAVGILESAIRQHPRDPDLWIGLGNALVLHSGGMMTPAAEFAFGRAGALAPGNPAPLFFYGLSLAEGGRLDEAEASWRQVLAMSPPTMSWRPLVEDRIRAIEQIRAMAEGRAPRSPEPQQQ
ncbi:MAG TPA: tetratricopeptide repeat protein [Allosphingosinicella sp.]|nr:tetratricopeptide repeat protein [Allosphingosinicella sp.]